MKNILWLTVLSKLGLGSILVGQIVTDTEEILGDFFIFLLTLSSDI